VRGSKQAATDVCPRPFHDLQYPTQAGTRPHARNDGPPSTQDRSRVRWPRHRTTTCDSKYPARTSVHQCARNDSPFSTQEQSKVRWLRHRTVSRDSKYPTRDASRLHVRNDRPLSHRERARVRGSKTGRHRREARAHSATSFFSCPCPSSSFPGMENR